MRLKNTYITAGIITLAIAGWMASGDLVIGGRSDAGAQEGGGLPPVAERQAEQKPFQVRVRRFEVGERTGVLEVKGRTQAEAVVEVKAETAGRITERPVQKGRRVLPGDLLCRLDRGPREARLLQAQAQLAQADFDFRGASQLNERGYAAQSRIEGAKAALDAARAAVKEAEVELSRTEIEAPVAGVVEAPIAEIGDTLTSGDTCATVVTLDPILAIGQVSERDVGMLEIGMAARVHLVSGEEVAGRLRFVSATADAATRTFRIEVAVENPDFRVRDGVTSRIALPLAPVPAHLVPPAVLALNDAGQVGVRLVGEDDVVAFAPVRILGEAPEGMWVAGLPDAATIITVGQNYVSDGTKVEPVFETAAVEDRR